MQLPPEDSQLQKTQKLVDALGEWNGYVGELQQLGKRQLDVLLNPSEGSSLDGILGEKDRVYRKAQEISQRVVRLEEDSQPDGGLAAQWEEIGRLRSEILETIRDLAQIESRSQGLVRDQMNRIQTELEGLQRGRRVTKAYGGAPARNPRFLDQKR